MDREIGGPEVTRHLAIERLPIYVDNMLNTLASLRGMTKKALIREALIDYVKRHGDDVPRLAALPRRKTT